VLSALQQACQCKLLNNEITHVEEGFDVVSLKHLEDVVVISKANKMV
jgi:hypothetical protein